MLRVIVADDHELVREAAGQHIRALASEVLILEAATYDEVCALGAPDSGAISLVLLDLRMPGYTGNDKFSGLRQVCRTFPDAAVVIFSASDDALTIAEALKNGARGYLTKTMRGRTLISALRLVLEGEIYIPPEMIGEVLGYQASAGPRQTGGDDSSNLQISERESAALRCLSRGMSNKEIARALKVQVATVKMHLRGAYRKLGASNRVEAVRIAGEKGLIA